MNLDVVAKNEDIIYPIIVENGCLKKCKEFLNLNRKVLIITDSGVPKEYSQTIYDNSKEAYIYTIEQGEASKCFDNYYKILEFMVLKHFSRTDCVVAVGGGVVGDLSGYVAKSYMRGIDFYNCPTTLLSELDSSIGGKCAIDFMGIKNNIGVFNSPKCVLIDPDTLKTLDIRQIHAGLCEAIKMALTSNKELFEFIKNSKDLMSDINHIIVEGLKIKKYVVETDPFEKDLRKVLNFGHTIGHAIEAIENGNLFHGECVGLGMLYFSSPKVKEEIKAVLKKYDLPNELKYNKDEIYKYITHDKKVDGSKINIVYVNEAGSFEFRKINTIDIMEYIIKEA